MVKQAMLNITELTAHYGSSQALFGMSLQLNEGEVVTLLGRNGMGKTTTLHSIMGIMPSIGGKVTGGSIAYKNNNVTGNAAYKIARLGLALVPEGRQIFPNLTVRENLIATAANRQKHKQVWSEERVLSLFPPLAERLSSMGNLLSGGEQQMLAISRALMTNPDLLILDDATEGLAPLVRNEIWQSIAQLKQQGLSILLVDKNLKDIMSIADRHYVVEKGTVVWSGNSQKLEHETWVRDKYLGV